MHSRVVNNIKINFNSNVSTRQQAASIQAKTPIPNTPHIMHRNDAFEIKVECTVLNLHDTLLETKEKNIKVDGVSHVKVAAPSNLPEGYVFDVTVGERIIQATDFLGGVGVESGDWSEVQCAVGGSYNLNYGKE